MKNESDKKGMFARLTGGKKAKKSCGCGSFEVEEIPIESENKDSKDPIAGNKKVRKDSCCGSFELEEISDNTEIDKDNQA